MLKKLIKYIKTNDWQPILLSIESIDDDRRKSLLKQLQALSHYEYTIQEPEDLFQQSLANVSKEVRKDLLKRRSNFYQERRNAIALYEYAIMVYNKADQPTKKGVQGSIYSLFRHPRVYTEAILSFFDKYPPTYVEKITNKITEDNAPLDFLLLWQFHIKGYYQFNEEIFVNSLLFFTQFEEREVVEYAQFLKDNPEALEKVFYHFHKYETKILDLSKWQNKQQSESGKIINFWTEVIKTLQEKGIELPREMVKNLLDTFTYTWKKPHINWHITILKNLKPTPEELLENQDLLFNALISENNTVVNYTVSTIKTIHQSDKFNIDVFFQNIDPIYVKEKIDKSIAVILKIVNFFFSIDRNYIVQYGDNLALGLIQSKTTTQALFAALIVKYLPKDKINALISPYLSSLKPKAQQLLNAKKIEVAALEKLEKQELAIIQIPNNWTDFLFHIGICLQSKSPKDIETFMDALIILQEEIPSDYKKQLKPYTKKLFKTFWELHSMINFAEFFHNWLDKNTEYISHQKWEDKTLPYLRHKFQLLHQKLQRKDHLPFLSTPTHGTFWVHPNTLINKILQHEKEKQDIDLQDLILATNRLLLDKTSKATLEKAKKLKGKYKEAIWYLIGISDKIKIQEDLLPLWAQVVRTKNPNNTFVEFEDTKAAKYPSVIKPFHIKYNIQKDNIWTRLTLENEWNRGRWKDTQWDLPIEHTYSTTLHLAHRQDVAYQLSFAPNYIDSILCLYIPDTTSYNEVQEIEQCQYPLQFLLENQIIVRHSGWLYIAQCLIFEKKISRDLAREYIRFALANQSINTTYFTEVVADMIVQKYAPINRLMESFEASELPTEIKELYVQIAQKCVEKVNRNSKPRNFKKIETILKELKK